MDVVLQTHTDDPMLALRDITRFADNSGFVAILQVRSGGFMLDRPFYYHGVGLLDFLSAISSMDRSLTGVAELRTPYEDDFIRFEVSTRGSVTVMGESREYSDLDQRLRFAFITDQTVLGPFARDLKAASCPDA